MPFILSWKREAELTKTRKENPTVILTYNCVNKAIRHYINAIKCSQTQHLIGDLP